MIYLPAVLAAAALWGIGPGLIAGVAAALAYYFFFTAPVHTFRIDRVTDVVTVVILLIVALVTSRLAAGIRAQARLFAHAARNATIAGFARRLLSCSTEDQIAATACEELHGLFGCNAALVSGLPEPHIVTVVPPGSRLTPSDVAAAALTLQTGKSAGRATPRIQPAEWQFHAVRTEGAHIAAIGLARDDGAPRSTRTSSCSSPTCSTNLRLRLNGFVPRPTAVRSPRFATATACVPRFFHRLAMI